MAPEVLLHGHVSKASDVYAFGITMWELFTAGTPFDGEGRGRVARQREGEGAALHRRHAV